MTLDVVVGGRYLDARGRTVTILHDRLEPGTNPGPLKHRFIGDQRNSYTSCGKCRRRDKTYSLVSVLDHLPLNG